MASWIFSKRSAIGTIHRRVERVEAGLRIWTGKAGDVGGVRIHACDVTTAATVIDHALATATRDGFARARTWGLVIRYPTHGERPVRDELARRDAVGLAIEREFVPRGLGALDGTDSGMGNWGLFYTDIVAPALAYRIARRVVASHGFADRATFALDEDDPSVGDWLWEA